MKIHYLTFDLDLRAKFNDNVSQYPLHHVTFAPVKFEVNTFNGYGGDAFTRIMQRKTLVKIQQKIFC